MDGVKWCRYIEVDNILWGVKGCRYVEAGLGKMIRMLFVYIIDT